MILNRKRILTLLCAGILFCESVGMTGMSAYAAEAVQAISMESYEEEENDPLYHKLSQRISPMSFGLGSEIEIQHNDKFKKYDKVYGIDVSKYQYQIDWEAVKEDGVEYAIIRLGYRGYEVPKLVTDTYFEANIEGAYKAGVGVGIYFFTQAITKEEAIEEADYVIEKLSDYPGYVSWPVVIDIENLSGSRLDAANLSREEKTEICEAFCEKIEAAGYQAGVYSGKYYWENDLEADTLAKNYFIWMAHYTDATDYDGTYHMWQYSSEGTIAGIKTRVDVDVAYGYRLSYQLNGGLNSSKNPAIYTGKKAVVLEQPTRKGYTFVGWYKDEELTDPITEIPKGSKEDITVYAKWTVNKYNIKFDGNGSTSGKMSQVKNRSYDKKYTLPKNKFQKKGYSFAGWNTKKDGSGKSYEDGDSVKNLTSVSGKTVKLYAQWTANQYNIRFMGNGNTSGEMKIKKACRYGKKYKLPVNTFKRKGYKFVGWNTKKNGKGTSYSNKTSVKNLTVTAGKTVKLYAQWKKK